MSLTLEIVSRHSQALGKRRVMTFGQDGGTIGRSVEADWSLPDAKRFLSGRHASIDFRSGSYYIVDMSKNGVFVNGAEDPVGKGKPQRLFAGDRIRIGDFEMLVTIDEFDDTDESLLSLDHIDPVDAKDRVEAPDPTGADLIEAHAITGVGIEMYLEDDDGTSLNPVFDGGSSSISADSLTLVKTMDVERPTNAAGPAPRAQTAPAARRVPKAKPAPAANPSPAAQKAPPARPTATDSPDPATRQAPARAAPTQQQARANAGVRPVDKDAEAAKTAKLNAFFRGAGIDPPQLSAREADILLVRLGQIMRELIVGVIDSLHLRALQKAQLKQSTTIIEPRENNRLKFSANFEEGFTRLFFDNSDDYISPVDSVRGAFADIKNHQKALMNATREALNHYLAQLDPDDIEQRASNGRKGALINAASKFKYWDVYRDVYLILANANHGELPEAFLDAFASAYRSSESKASTAKEDSRDTG